MHWNQLRKRNIVLELWQWLLWFLRYSVFALKCQFVIARYKCWFFLKTKPNKTKWKTEWNKITAKKKHWKKHKAKQTKSFKYLIEVMPHRQPEIGSIYGAFGWNSKNVKLCMSTFELFLMRKYCTHIDFFLSFNQIKLETIFSIIFFLFSHYR